MKASVKTHSQNYFEKVAKEVASSFVDKTSANVFKQALLEWCFMFPQSLLKRAHEQGDFGAESTLTKKNQKKIAKIRTRIVHRRRVEIGFLMDNEKPCENSVKWKTL